MLTPEQIDEVGRIKAQIAALEEQIEPILRQAKESPGRYKGNLFEINVFEQSRTNVDWKSLCRDHGILQAVIDKYSTFQKVLVAKVGVRT